MRPVLRGECPKSADGTDISFSDHREARDPLISRIGDYCSYCEVCLHSSIDVEHVQPKIHHGSLKLKWTNFLLACSNCNSIKRYNDVLLNDYFWPDRDNTARAFDYDVDQPPRIKTGLDFSLHQTATNTIKLTGLDRVPGHESFSDRDRRWLKRREAWGVAIDARRTLAQTDTPEMRRLILLNAVSRGFWSVWMEVFADDVEMRGALIAWFTGTARDCFDSMTRPVPRRGGQV
jgi:HNH endonuclease